MLRSTPKHKYAKGQVVPTRAGNLVILTVGFFEPVEYFVAPSETADPVQGIWLSEKELKQRITEQTKLLLLPHYCQRCDFRTSDFDELYRTFDRPTGESVRICKDCYDDMMAEHHHRLKVSNKKTQKIEESLDWAVEKVSWAVISILLIGLIYALTILVLKTT